MKRRTLGTLSVALLLVAAVLLGRGLDRSVWAQTGGSYDVEWHVLASAGDQLLAGGAYRLGFSLGQPHAPGISGGGSDQVVQGYWASGGIHPTAVSLIDFYVESRDGALRVCWETAAEIDNLGFHLYRSESGQPGSYYTRLNEHLIPSQAPGGSTGAFYEWVDPDVVPGQTYHYLLEDIDSSGQVTAHGPVEGTLFQFRLYLPRVAKGY